MLSFLSSAAPHLREHNNMIVSSREIIITNRAQWAGGGSNLSEYLNWDGSPLHFVIYGSRILQSREIRPGLRERESEKESSSEEEGIFESLESR